MKRIRLAIYQFGEISRFWWRIWCLPADIVLRILEAELVAITTASECTCCAGDAGWPHRRPCMAPDVCVPNPETWTDSLHPETSQMSEMSICQKIYKAVFLINKHLYI